MGRGHAALISRQPGGLQGDVADVSAGQLGLRQPDNIGLALPRRPGLALHPLTQGGIRP